MSERREFVEVERMGDRARYSVTVPIEVDPLHARIGALEQRVDGNAEQIRKDWNAHFRHYGYLEERLTKVEKRIDALELRIDRLDGMLDGMGKGAESRFEAIECRIEALEKRCGKIAAFSYGDNDSRIKDHERRIEKMERKLNHKSVETPGESIKIADESIKNGGME